MPKNINEDLLLAESRLAESPLIAVPHGKKRILAYGEDMIRVGKKLSGRLLDGVEHNERPW